MKLPQFKIIGLFFAFAISSSHISAQDFNRHGMETTTENAPKGLEVGNQAPNFTTVNQHSEKITLSNILNNDKRVVLFFYRGNWCPICTRYLSMLKDSVDQILQLNAEVIAISPESKEELKKTQAEYNLPFHVVADENSEIAESYNLLFDVTDAYQSKIQKNYQVSIAEHNNQDDARLPVPATFVINSDGEIIYTHFDYNYRQRAPVHEIVESLK